MMRIKKWDALYFLRLAVILFLAIAAGGARSQAPAKILPKAGAIPTSATLAKENWELLGPLVVERLDNGMTFLLYPNHRTPVFSGVIRFDVGGKDEETGQTGIAHMFEHMAFKGTQQIGTRNWPAEKKALEVLELAAAAFDDARNRAVADKLTPEEARKRLTPAAEAFKKAQAQAEQYVVKNEFDEIYEREGGYEENAQTGNDATQYYISLPSNRIELWARMEAGRLASPVMREFYSERDVVMEERRMRNDNNPVGKLWELAMSIAFVASPYHNPVIGFEADIRNLKADEAYKFFRTHYTPERGLGVLVGEFDVEKTRQLLRETFGKLPQRPKDAPVEHIIPEPPQQGERRVKLTMPASPVLMLAWHKPNLPDPADVQVAVLSQVVAGGRSARWFERLVKQRHLAAQIDTGSTPGDALPNLFIAEATPQPGVSLEALEKAIREEVEKLKTEPVSEEELARAKKSLRADTTRALQTNLGLAEQLAETAQISKDPYYLERRLRQIEGIKAEDLREFARKYMVDTNLTVATLEPPATGKVDGEKANDGKAGENQAGTGRK